MLRLSSKWVSELANHGETGMGYQVVTVYLKDGRRFEQVVHLEGFLTQIRGHTAIPFSDDDIARIEVTHDKWNFNASSS